MYPNYIITPVAILSLNNNHNNVGTSYTYSQGTSASTLSIRRVRFPTSENTRMWVQHDKRDCIISTVFTPIRKLTKS